MKLILKNSEILFKTREPQELTPVSVLNSPRAFYVIADGSRVSGGSEGGGNVLYVNIYQVTAGTTYHIKSSAVNPNPSSGMTVEVGIAFGTNLLSQNGNISNSQLIKAYDIRSMQLYDFDVAFTPSQNGYIYITEINETQSSTPGIGVCLSSVFE